MADQACIAAIKAVAPELTDAEAAQIDDAVAAARKKLAATGKVAGLDDAVFEAAARAADQQRIKALMLKKHAALNVIRRDAVDKFLRDAVKNGLKHREAVMSLLTGTWYGVENGRRSISAQRAAYGTKYIGQAMDEIVSAKPHLVAALRKDKPFSERVHKEMIEPGSTKDADARFVAEVMSKYSELARLDLNKLGAFIGKTDRWAPQNHDADKLLKVTQDKWVYSVANRLDFEKTFPDVLDPDAQLGILSEIYTTITTGQARSHTARGTGKFTQPANYAKTLGMQRILHFKSADDAVAYHAEYGHGTVFTSFVDNQHAAARVASLMSVLGPNPQVMLDSVLEAWRIEVRGDKSINEAKRAKIIQSIDVDLNSTTGRVAKAWQIVTGAANAGSNNTWGKVTQGILTWQMLSRLGGTAVVSINDLATAAARLKVNGVPVKEAFANQVEAYAYGLTPKDRRAFLFGVAESYSGMIDAIASPWIAGDNVPGIMSKAATAFMKWQGVTYMTDVQRQGLSRALSKYMDMWTKDGWGSLTPNQQHNFGLHGVGEADFKLLAQATRTARGDGAAYLLPQDVRTIPLEKFDPVIGDQLAAINARIKDQAKRDIEINRQRGIARDELEMKLRRYYSDEVGRGVLTGSDRAKILTTGGAPASDATGALTRLVMQFKGYPIQFTQDVLYPMIVGGRGDSVASRLMNNSGNIATLVSGLMVFGYISQTARDMLAGKTARDPTMWENILQVGMLAGGAGFYNDFLLGKYNQYGQSATEALAGPTLGSSFSAVNYLYASLMHDGEDVRKKAGYAVNQLISSIPGNNLWMFRPALDILVLNNIREGLSPGYLDRQREKAKELYGQSQWLPQHL